MADDVSKVSKGIHLYADFDARGVGMEALDPNTGVDFRFLEVPTPAWFPDSFLRSLKRNLYFNMVNNASYYGTALADANKGTSLDFYKDTSGNGIIGNLVNTAVKSIVSTAANQVMSLTSKVDSVVNGVSSLLGGGGNSENSNLYSMINEVSRNPFLASQPYIKVYGIHLAENLRDAWDAVDSLGTIISNEFSKLVRDNDFTSNMTELMKKWNEGLTKAMKSLKILDENAGNDVGAELQKTLTTPKNRMHNFAETQMLCGISGYYTMTCKLPFFGNNAPMFKSSGTNAFKTGYGYNNPHQNALIELARKYTNIIWNNPIKWSPDEVGSDRIIPINYNFNIYNDTLEHMLTNLVFIWSFGATTQSVTDIVTLRPPYLYDIEIPGGLRFKYCICGFQVTPQGKLRKISNGGDDIIGKLFKQIFGFTVNPNAISHVPDYYKVEIVFTPLLPNLWNFVDSYLHDADSKPKTGDEIRHILTKVLKDFKEG